MPKFNANLTMLFNEVDFLDRFDAAAKLPASTLPRSRRMTAVALTATKVAISDKAVTDTAGRFCIACPAGRHTLRVDARGHGGVARAVDIEGDIVEVRITLSPVP